MIKAVPVVSNCYDEYCSVCLLSTLTAAGKSILLGHIHTIHTSCWEALCVQEQFTLRKKQKRKDAANESLNLIPYGDWSSVETLSVTVDTFHPKSGLKT